MNPAPTATGERDVEPGEREASTGARAPRTVQPRRGTVVQRLRVRGIAIATWVVARLPEGALLRLADFGGGIVYRRSPDRRAHARRNLARVAAWASATGAGSPALRAAADDPLALDALVLAAFRQHARYWVELSRAPRVTPRYLRDRILVEDAAVLDAAFADARPAVYIGLHFGVIEATALWLARFGGRPVVAPMETVADPELQRWFVATRGSLGIRLVGLREARRELLNGLRSGAAVAIVGDRDLTGGGVPTELFGHPAPLPAGPALLVLETGMPAYAAVVRRVGLGRYRARVIRLEPPAEGSRRERLEAFLAAEARCFESFILDAPEQWWGAFYPIWPDLEEPTA